MVSPRSAVTLLLLLALPAAAIPKKEPRSVDAESALAGAVASAQAGRWEDALTTVDRALALSPRWPEALFVRAGIHAHLAGAEASVEAFATPVPGRDYPTVLGHLRGAVEDLKLYLTLTPAAPDRTQVIAALGDLEARIAAATAASKTVERELAAQKLAAEEKQRREELLASEQRAREQRLREEADARRILEAEARQREAAQARADRARAIEERRLEELQTARESFLSRRAGIRTAGVVLLLGGAASGAGAGGFAALGLNVNARVKTGTFDTGASLTRLENDGKAYNIGAYTCLAVGGAALIAGLVTMLTQLGEPPAFALGFDGRTVQVSGAW